MPRKSASPSKSTRKMVSSGGAVCARGRQAHGSSSAEWRYSRPGRPAGHRSPRGACACDGYRGQEQLRLGRRMDSRSQQEQPQRRARQRERARDAAHVLERSSLSLPGGRTPAGRLQLEDQLGHGQRTRSSASVFLNSPPTEAPGCSGIDLVAHERAEIDRDARAQLLQESRRFGDGRLLFASERARAIARSRWRCSGGHPRLRAPSATSARNRDIGPGSGRQY